MTDNELIAEFMGFHVYDCELFGDMIRVYSIKTDDSVIRQLSAHHVSQLKYQSSWDWLMSVVEKIRKYVIDECLFGNEYYDALCIALIEVNIHDCHFEVVEFIKWYNQNK